MSVSHTWLLIGILKQVTLYHIYYPLYHRLIINSKMASMWWLPDGGFQKAVAEQVLALISFPPLDLENNTNSPTPIKH